MFKDDPKIKEVFQYAKEKWEVVRYSEKIHQLKEIGKVVATAHLCLAVPIVLTKLLFPDIAKDISVLAMWKVAPLSAPVPGSFTGFLDTYSTNGATWGFSTFKLKGSYAGNWGTVQRQSDNATQVIGWDANSVASVSTFNAFCAGTNCYATTLVDQVNGINATQATLANMPRVIVDSNNSLAVCGTPTSSMSTSFNAAVNTAKVHMFAVARAGFADNNWVQPGVPTVSVTGNVATGSSTISAMSSQVGISTSTGGNGTIPARPGVSDSANFLPNAPTAGTTGATWLNTLPTGTTASLLFAPGFLSPTGTQTGDTLTFTNAVTGGTWIMNGPASATMYTTAYWGVGMGLAGGSASDLIVPRNGEIVGGSNSNLSNIIGQGMRGQWGVYDWDTNTAKINYDAVNIATFSGAGTANVTYTTNVGMTLFADASGSETASNNCFETIVLFNQTEASRVAMAQFLMTQAGISFPFAPTTSDGFTMAGVYQPLNSNTTASVYGQSSYGPDVWGMTWLQQSGGYTYPSIARATNINNSATMWRFIVHQGDSDTNITQAERSEVSFLGTDATPGNSWSQFYQFEFEAIPTQTGDFCGNGQVHYDNGAGSPDALTFNCKNNQIQFISQQSSGDTNCGTPQTLTVGTVYAVVVTAFWSTNHTSDTLTVNFGPNGSTLPQLCNRGPTSIFDTAAVFAYMKMGTYRGFPWSNAGTVIVRYMNGQFNGTTANAYSAYITTQPALPTHP
jgi:hypothetical protein